MPDMYCVRYDGDNISLPARVPLSTAYKIVELAQEHLRIHGLRLDLELQERRRRTAQTNDVVSFVVTVPDPPILPDYGVMP